MTPAGPAADAARPLRVRDTVAGEHSGDTLGAALIRALRERVAGVECFGVAGPKMLAAGCQAWAGADELGVMGLTEVVRHLPRLLRLRRQLKQRFLAEPPDVFIGIDAPEFNLTLARGLKSAGIRTVQYVSPQVWAWRQGRVRTLGAAVDLVLCLLPFETDFYQSHGVRAEFVGHPLADQIPLASDHQARGAAYARPARGRGAGGAPARQPHERGVAPGATLRRRRRAHRSQAARVGLRCPDGIAGHA